MEDFEKQNLSLTHCDASGRARMVDVSEKAVTRRLASASGFVSMSPSTVRAIALRRTPKGDPLEVARLAGVMAAKRTAEIIPLCHPLFLEHVEVLAELGEGGVSLAAHVVVTGKTGAEMEALTAVSAAALSIYDMCKAVDRELVIGDIRLEAKSGGRSGDFRRATAVNGHVEAVCVSAQVGVQKKPVERATLVADHGITGDAHAGPGIRQVSLLAAESADEIRDRGALVVPGAFGENLLTRGIELKTLSVGARLQVGEAQLEVTQIGKECHTRCAIYEAAGTCAMPTEGVFCRVVASGQVAQGDAIARLKPRQDIAAVLVASDSRSGGAREDLSGPACAEALAALDIGVIEIAVVEDDIDKIAAQLAAFADRGDLSLVLTSGGTGLGPRDVTVEATLRVIERAVPGIPEMIRQHSAALTPHAALSRAVAGIRGRTLIVNLPGSPQGVRETIQFLAPLLPHALEVVAGRAVECASPK